MSRQIRPCKFCQSFEPSSGTYSVGQRIILSSTLPGTALHYTIDGSLPSADSPIYSAPLVLSAAETVRVIAVADGVASSVAAAYFAVSPLHLVFSTQPSAVPLGVAFSPAPAVSIADASGNVFAVPGYPITLSLGANPGSATLEGNTTIVPVLGTAIFAGVTINSAGSGYTLVATSPGVEARQLDLRKLRQPGHSTDFPLLRDGDVLVVSTSKFAKVERIIHLSNIGLYYPLP